MARSLWVGVWDVHYPHIHRPTWNAALDFIDKNQENIAGFLFGGDQFDNAEISHHTSGKPLLRPPGSFARNTRGFDTLLTDLEERLPSKAEKVWIEGNHDAWIDQLIERQPELQGVLERPLILNLEERGWEVLQLGEGKKLGKLNAYH